MVGIEEKAELQEALGGQVSRTCWLSVKEGKRIKDDIQDFDSDKKESDGAINTSKY